MKHTPILILCAILLLFGCTSKPEKTISEKLNKPNDTFLIDNNSDTLIQGKEGTLIYIEKGSFTDLHGDPILDSIEIVMKEVYKMKDILSQNISMRTDSQLLETGGMINVQALSGGRNLLLKPGKELVVHFPKGEVSKKMNLFYGKENSSSTVEWDLEESSSYQLIDSIVPWYHKYEFLDEINLQVESGEHWTRYLPRLFNLTDEDREELLNKVVEVNYIVHSNGELEYTHTSGSKISKRLKKKLVGVAKNFPKCRPYSRKGVPMEMKGFFKIFTSVQEPKFKSKKAYRESIEKKLQEGNSSGLAIAELQYYIFDSKKLGWMNCDRFIDNPSERVVLEVKVPRSKNIFTKIVFRNYKTVMSGNELNGLFVFDKLPLNEPIKVVVIDEKNGKPLLKIIDAKVSRAPIEVTDLKEYTLEELSEKLNELE